MMINNVMTILLFIGILYIVFHAYREIRIDLFRDSVFKIRRALFIIAANNPDEFLKGNSSYRYFENILNTALSYTADFSLIHVFLDVVIRRNYAKKKHIKVFDYENFKKTYLEKIQSPETREEVAKLLDDFQYSYILFLMTRTFFGAIFFILLIGLFIIYFAIKAIYEKRKEDLERTALAYSSINQLGLKKTMNNSNFAYAVSGT